MVYKVIISPRAQLEIEDAIDFYLQHSLDAPKKFRNMLIEAYKTLKNHPYFKIRYKNIRSLKIKKYPYSLYFVIDESKKTVRVLSCFHNKRNPSRRPD